MNLSLSFYTWSFPSYFAGYSCTIRDRSGISLVVFATSSPTSVISRLGTTNLDASGKLSIWLRENSTVMVEIRNAFGEIVTTAGITPSSSTTTALTNFARLDQEAGLNFSSTSLVYSSTPNGIGSSASTTSTTNVAGSDGWLTTYATVGLERILTNIVRDPTYKTVTAANVIWPDGSTGVYSTLATNSVNPIYVDSYSLTYVPTTGSVRTITQPAFTRDASGGITGIPPLVIV
jgi:hypothetical protein